MQKEKHEIITHQTDFINFVQQLKNYNDQELRKPIEEDKWSVIEIIAHFFPWDEFIMQQRLPYFFKETTFPPGPNADEVNYEAALLARSNTIQSTIDKCLLVRRELVQILTTLPEEKWFVEMKINQSPLTIYSYFKGLMKHDLHHIEQIKQSLQIK
ncbi:DinB family protein [Solibacillus sp. FSL R7-0682]|uniref:DinB family protein n=1 Tax=Solibacillus sp. FSL R7-0682 TaxID=2921690 RepID=UPI0030FC6E94